MHFPIDVTAGGAVTVTATKTAGSNAVLSGIFFSDDVVLNPPPPPPPPPPPVESAPQGDWVGVYGADGHVLAGWNGSSDEVSLWFGSATLDQGNRYVWSASTTDVRALESADEGLRRAAGFYHSSQVQVSLDVTTDYAGVLHVYALDWDSTARRQSVTVDDGSGPQTVDIVDSFGEGAWMHFPIDVTAGGAVTVTATKTAGSNAVLSGIFFSDDVVLNPPPPPPIGAGDWVGVYGADGHVLAAWDGSSDLVDMPLAAVTLDAGNRYRWSPATTDVRALEAPDESTRRAATYYSTSEIALTLTFGADYSGVLHLYALDWDTTARRQTVTVDDGSTPQIVDLVESFGDGAWMHFPINVTAGGAVTITVTKTAGSNAVLSGIFLGGAA
jgi:hypothetical protein